VEEWVREHINEMLREFRRMREMLDSIERSFFQAPFGPEERSVTPLYEVRRYGDRIVVCADLAGVKRREDIDVSVEGNNLRIEARLHRAFIAEGFAFGRLGIEKYHLEIPLPENVDTEAIRATFRKGMLEVVIPLKQQRVRIRVE